MSGDDGLRAEDVARRFHETYERLAPSFGYETRRESAVPWEQVPEQNRQLMIAVCEEVTAALRAKADAANRVRELIFELEIDSERAYQRSCGHRDEGSDGQYRAYEDAADRIREALDGPPC